MIGSTRKSTNLAKFFPQTSKPLKFAMHMCTHVCHKKQLYIHKTVFNTITGTITWLITTQQLFKFQKIIFLLLPLPSRGSTTGLSSTFPSTFDATSTTLLSGDIVVRVQFFATGHCDGTVVTGLYICDRNELC